MSKYLKIAVNVAALSENRLCGIGYYLKQLLRSLAHPICNESYFFISNKPICHVPKGPNCHSHIVKGKGLTYWKMAKAAQLLECDLAFVPGEVVPLGMKKPVVIVVHDLFALICPKECKKELSLQTQAHFLLARALHCKRADLLIAVSENTKKEIVELCNIPQEKIRVIAHGVDKNFFSAKRGSALQSVLDKYAIQSPYFINTSSLWWARKNLLRLIEAFAQFHFEVDNGCQLVITGNKGPSFAAMRAAVERYGLEKQVRFLHYVDREDIPYLFSAALALVFPSLHEGFGMPVIEAMSCGCPVITSHTSALVETGGLAALYINPYQSDSIAQAMRDIYRDSALRESHRHKGLAHVEKFSWQRAANATRQVFYELLR